MSGPEKDCGPTQTENETECGHSRGELFASQECEIDRRDAENLYRKKPVVIEAQQWNGSVGWATAIIDWILDGGGTARYVDYAVGCSPYLAVDTLEGVMRASAGDWIIRGVQGEFYPCKPDIFAATYEAVSPTPSRTDNVECPTCGGAGYCVDSLTFPPEQIGQPCPDCTPENVETPTNTQEKT